MHEFFESPFAALVFAACICGCSQTPNADHGAPPSPSPESQTRRTETGDDPLAEGSRNVGETAPPPAGGDRTPGSGGISGTVAEVLTAGRYTYVRLDTDGGQVWAAAPASPVQLGDEVALPPGMTMVDFHSRILDRTFDRILFVGYLQIQGGETEPPGSGALPDGHPPLRDPGAPSVPARDDGAPESSRVELGDIEKPEGGMTVAEILSRRVELAGKEVLLRAKVVRYNAEILGTNWLHVQDGSGRPGMDDLTVRTGARASVGDLVVIRGTVALDRDFGAGYRYAVLLEDATVTVE